jgi:predicted nucleic acid-binding protein
MILYLGSSALIKLYIEEEYSDFLRMWVHEAEIVATCRVTYTEVTSALELRLKQNDIQKNDYEIITKRFSKDWSNYAIIDFDDQIAAHYIKKYGLRRFDAIHLSSAMLIRKTKNDFLLLFASANNSLCKAAEAEGITVLHFN